MTRTVDVETALDAVYRALSDQQRVSVQSSGVGVGLLNGAHSAIYLAVEATLKGPPKPTPRERADAIMADPEAMARLIERNALLQHLKGKTP